MEACRLPHPGKTQPAVERVVEASVVRYTQVITRHSATVACALSCTHPAIECVVEVVVVRELGCQHDPRQQQAVHVEGRGQHGGVALGRGHGERGHGSFRRRRPREVGSGEVVKGG